MDITTIYRPGIAVRRAWAANRPLTLVGLAMMAVLAVTVVGLTVDPRVITGAPAWLKPAKFALSIAIYTLTFVWLLTFLRGRPRLVRAVSWVTAVALGLEMVLIGGAAAAGTTSHFNVSTPVQTAIWSTMGSAIVIAWVASLVVAVALFRQAFADAALGWALRLGVVIGAVGMGVAFFMTSPTAEQIATANATGAMAVSGAHSVGTPDGGPGLPIVGWSTVGGDLRVAHFLGLHALQALPLLAVLLRRFGPGWLGPLHRVRLIWTIAAAYLAVVALTTWQALRGQPLTAPDALTLSVAGAIAAVAAGAVLVILAQAVRAARAAVAQTRTAPRPAPPVERPEPAGALSR
jgi:hypothetical protein